jgi:hypothetical protein
MATVACRGGPTGMDAADSAALIAAVKQAGYDAKLRA